MSSAGAIALGRYYELRIYQCAAGRVEELHHRMCFEIPPGFKRHGVTRPLAYWDGFAGSLMPAYVYILRWDSLDERMAAFTNFYADPERLALRKASKDAAIVTRTDLSFLRPSPVWPRHFSPPSADPIGGVHELRLQDVSAKDPAEAHRIWGELDLPYLKAAGATVLGIFSTWLGTRMPQLVTLLAWPDLETRTRAYQDYDQAPRILDVRAAERRKYGAVLFGRTDVHLLRPAWYGTPRANLAELPDPAY